ncbi:uncharacterized protein EV420DRAFT_1481134 [Desarmillaria tabescens]|uniref:LysM domain-containing protein n=1 Tax=Armillaria tabescens TaxID=1929756 RepID=A0AA39K798_ARMTA|nr:uncharacterized protein EV420DRAFT_1481134 [Desarmillaria tabescens]KAK0455682.1 hypothetical protein EV420DRAFT_1481134 [Desarmillaria tabescens]
MLFTSTFALLLTILNLSAAQEDCSRSYVIATGDTCNSICQAQGVSNYQLGLVNPLIDANCDNLIPGQVICLGFFGHDCTETHTVVAGDSCNSVVAAAGIDDAVFMCNNKNINENCSNLDIGYVVCVSAGLMGYPGPCPSNEPALFVQ